MIFISKALYYAGIFLLHIDRADKAKEYVDRYAWLIFNDIEEEKIASMLL